MLDRFPRARFLAVFAAMPFLLLLAGCPRNSAPDVPAAPTGQTTGYPDSSYEYTASTLDPDGDSIGYVFSWGDGDTSPQTDFLLSGLAAVMSHSWDSVGSYQVTVFARDATGLESGWSQALEVTIVARPNTPPLAPEVPDGPTEVLEDSVCSFRVTGTDPENDRLAYRFSWGDGDTSGWSDFLGQGAYAEGDHSWAHSGRHEVRAQAKDELGALSAWSDSLPVEVYQAFPFRVLSVFSSPAPEACALLPNGEFLYVANGEHDIVSVYRTSDNSLVTTISVGSFPYRLAVLPNGEYVYVTNSSSDDVSVIRTADNSVVATIPVGDWPEGIAALPDGKRVYVANRNERTLSVIDTEARIVVAQVEVDRQPEALAVLPDGRYVYAGCDWDNTLAVVSTAEDTMESSFLIGSGLYGMAVSPDGEQLFVSVCHGEEVVVVRTSDNTVLASVPSGGFFGPSGLAALPNGQYFYVAGFGAHEVRVVRTADLKVVHRIPVCGIALDIDVNAGGTMLYVPHFAEDSISVIGFPD